MADTSIIVLSNFSREFFLKHFFPAILKMTKDPVWNIRLQTCRLFAEIKRFLMYPANEREISQMEQSVRELLKENTTANNQQILQQV